MGRNQATYRGLIDLPIHQFIAYLRIVPASHHGEDIGEILNAAADRLERQDEDLKRAAILANHYITQAATYEREAAYQEKRAGYERAEHQRLMIAYLKEQMKRRNEP